MSSPHSDLFFYSSTANTLTGLKFLQINLVCIIYISLPFVTGDIMKCEPWLVNCSKVTGISNLHVLENFHPESQNPFSKGCYNCPHFIYWQNEAQNFKGNYRMAKRIWTFSFFCSLNNITCHYFTLISSHVFYVSYSSAVWYLSSGLFPSLSPLLHFTFTLYSFSSSPHWLRFTLFFMLWLNTSRYRNKGKTLTLHLTALV